MTEQSTAAAAPRTLDRADERLQENTGLGGIASGTVRRIRSGDLGALPVVIGLIIVWVVFQILNPVFLSTSNIVNLTLECVSVGVIALGIVCVLLVGQIDLSVGSVSGLSGAVTAVLFVNEKWPLALAILASIVVGVAIGGLYSLLFNRLGMPSFVATLAGLLAFLGLQLYLLGDIGSINIPFDSPLVQFAQLDFVPKPLSYVFVVLAAAAVFLTGQQRATQRRRAGLSANSIQIIIVRTAATLIVLGGVVWYLNQGRGLGWMFLFFAVLVGALHYALTRTRWGRSMFAVGGNAEAARRAGINVKRVYASAFLLCSTLAAIGGVLAAARLGSANQSSGTGDVNLNAIAAAVIGGTSLFGGRGSASSALLGIVVIQSISSGLTLLNLSPSFRFMITGLVLAIAVGIDSLARRSRASHGQA